MTPTIRRRTLILATLAGALVVASACGGGSDGSGPDPRQPASVELVTGDGQAATVGTAVAVAPAVRVRNTDGAPLAGVSVSFTAGAGVVQGSPAVTGDDGVATAGGWTLGAGAGPQVLVARVPGLAGDSVAFHATGLAGPPASLTIFDGNAQTWVAGFALVDSVGVRVADAFGNPVAGVVVQFTVTAGGGSVSGAVDTTSALGIARPDFWTLGALPGPNALQASVVGGALPSVSFTATGTTGPASSIQLVSGDAQTGLAGGLLPESLVVRVTDMNLNPVAGATVVFTVLAGGGQVSAAQVVTGANGQAATAWTLGPALGLQAVGVTVPADGLSLLPAIPATAAPATWTGAVSRDWHLPGNWLLAHVPGPTDTAYVPAGTPVTPLVTAPATVAGLQMTGGDVEVGPTTLTVLGELRTSGTGTLTMTDPAAVVDVNDLTVFEGGSETGRLTAGTLRVGGFFVQQGLTTAFAASGTHRTILDGAQAQTVQFTVPGALASHFSTLEIAKSGGTVDGNYLFVTHRLDITTPTAVTGQSVYVLGRVSTAPGSSLGGTVGFFNLDSLQFGGTFAIPSVYGVAGTTLPASLTGLDIVLKTGGPVTLTGARQYRNLTVESGDLVLAGHTLQLAFLSLLGPNATLTMTNPLDTLITGTFSTEGGDTRGKLTAGYLQALTFNQSGVASVHSFAASGTHTTRVGRSTAQGSLTMMTPGVDSSHFQRLELAGPIGVVAPRVLALGPLATVGSAASVAGFGFPGSSLDVAGLEVNFLVLDQVPVRSTGGTLVQFDHVTFQNFAPSAVQLTLDHPGTGAPFVMQGLTFSPTLTIGLYLDAVDSDGTAPTLTLEVHSTLAPGVGAAGTRTSAGPGPVQAQVTWP